VADCHLATRGLVASVCEWGGKSVGLARQRGLDGRVVGEESGPGPKMGCVGFSFSKFFLSLQLIYIMEKIFLCRKRSMKSNSMLAPRVPSHN